MSDDPGYNVVDFPEAERVTKEADFQPINSIDAGPGRYGNISVYGFRFNESDPTWMLADMENVGMIRSLCDSAEKHFKWVEENGHEKALEVFDKGSEDGP